MGVYRDDFIHEMGMLRKKKMYVRIPLFSCKRFNCFFSLTALFQINMANDTFAIESLVSCRNLCIGKNGDVYTLVSTYWPKIVLLFVLLS